jgi:hypothetical protein
MAVTLLKESDSGNGGNGTKTDVCDAILPQYADVVDIRSDITLLQRV